MNPIFTVSIDTEKRKASTAGLVAVGEKVDVVVTGLDATQIPEWEQDNDEGFSGLSLRFRLVAPDGKDLVRFPLAEGDAWTIGAEGELTAEVDFNTMPLRHWFHGYEIGAKAEVGMILDSVVDAMEYGRGTVKVLQWTASPAEDPTILPDWRKTLRDLNAAIVEIKDSVDLAEGYANDAEASAGVATEKADIAETAANNALSSQSAAAGFKDAAQTAAGTATAKAEEAAASADTATTKAEEAADSAGDAAQILEDIEEAIAGKAEQSDLEAEVTRATQKEEALEDGLTEANDAISANADAIAQLEESKADKTALDTLSDAIDSEAETREEKDAAICAKLNKEIADRQGADNLKADKATTYTKTEVDTKIAGVQTFQKYLVNELPDADEADMKGMYLVPMGETTEEGDLCEEWTVVEEDGEKRWEKIGGTEIDLSGYEVVSNKVTSMSSASTNTQYPSAKCVYDAFVKVEGRFDPRFGVSDTDTLVVYADGTRRTATVATFTNGSFTSTNLRKVYGGTSCTTVGPADYYGSIVFASFPYATTVNYNSFYNWQNLENVELPLAQSIGESAFYNCKKLKKISLPSCTQIDQRAFRSCIALEELNFGSVALQAIPTIASNSFYDASTSAVIVVPDDNYAAWVADADWTAARGSRRIVKYSDWEMARKCDLSGYKPLQTAVSDPTASGAAPEFIASITQDANGVVTVTKKAVQNVVSVKWSVLKALRDGGNLVPGRQYRITDYVATTKTSSTRSANHPFDLIVTADSAGKLNEKARAVQHDGDVYFSGCNLSAWEVWYCLDNDTARFAWALDDEENETDSQTHTGGRGIVYRLIDEFQNDVPYDFKGIQFLANGDADNVYRYTFDSGAATGNADLSLDGGHYASGVHNNIIDVAFRYSSSGNGNRHRAVLNCIVFKGAGCNCNIFGKNCTGNTFGADCKCNIFGNNCHGNTFGANCRSNIFGNDCGANTFGDECYDNLFGVYNTSNIFGDSFTFNKTGNYCTFNRFGSSCYANSLGSYCSGNFFGDYCHFNSFGNDCNRNVLGNYCDSNIFENDCVYNVFGAKPVDFSTETTYHPGDYVFYDRSIFRCTIEHTGDWGTWDDEPAHFVEDPLAIASAYYRRIKLENGVKDIFLDCTGTRGSGVYFQNVTVASSVEGTMYIPKVIQNADSPWDFKTTYQPASSQIVRV